MSFIYIFSPPERSSEDTSHKLEGLKEQFVMEPFREKGWSQGDLGCWEAELISSLEHSVNMNLKLYEEKIKSTARQYCNGVIKMM